MDLSFARAESLIERGLALFLDHLPRLDEYAASWPDEEQQFIRPRDKLAVEVALMLLVLSRAAHRLPALRPRLDRLASTIEPHVRGPRLRSLLLGTPSTAVTLGAGHAYLQAAGYPDPTVERLVRRCLDLGAERMIERVPYRAMDVRWMLGLSDPSKARFDDLLPLSILGGNATSATMSAQDAYAFTHAVMYLTDFGQRPLPMSLPPARMPSLLEGGIASWLLAEDFDILVEMLIVAACDTRPWPPHARLAWEVLVGVWDRLGFLPAPGLNRAEHAAAIGDNAASIAFRDLYHTNLVGVILAALVVMRPPSDGPPAIASPAFTIDAAALEHAEREARLVLQRSRVAWSARSPSPSASPLDAALGRCLSLRLPGPPESAPWLAGARVSGLDDGVLARVAFDAAILHAARTGDLANLAHALRESRAAGHAESPAWSDGARLLMHAIGPSGLFGHADDSVDVGSPASPSLLDAAARTLEIVSALRDHAAPR